MNINGLIFHTNNDLKHKVIKMKKCFFYELYFSFSSNNILDKNLSTFVSIYCHSLNGKLQASTFQTAINLLGVRSAWDIENILWIVSYLLMRQAYNIHKPAAVYILKITECLRVSFCLLLSFLTFLQFS